MSSYPPPPIKLPPAYLPLPHGQLGPANPFPFPNPQMFIRSSGQFHPSTITNANAERLPVLPATLPHQSPGQMRWPQAQFQPQKWVTQYAGPDQDLGSAELDTKTLGLRAAAAIGVAALMVALLP